jgi:hypothetical protein
MATIATRGAVGHPKELSVEMASRIAWWTWLVLLLAPFVLFLIVMYQLVDTSAAADRQMSTDWFIGAMAYLCIAVPLAVFYRGYLFRPYYRGEVVPPRAYLTGQIAVWLALEIGGIVSLVGCLVSKAFVPCMLPAIAAFLFFLPMWPSGMAMVRRNTGNADDPGRYQEPR